MLPGIRRELPVEGSAGKMSENTRNIQNDGKTNEKLVEIKRNTDIKKVKIDYKFKNSV